MPIEDRSLDIPEDAEDWECTRYRLESQNSGGQVPGHYLKLDGDTLMANDTGSDSRSIFKLHSHSARLRDGRVGYCYVLEHVDHKYLAINKADDTVVMKDDFDINSIDFRRLSSVQYKRPELVFYRVLKEPGSNEFCFESYLPDKVRVLGFGENGKALNTAEVKPGDKASLFKRAKADH